ncbi:MAG: S8 family serine peptidase [Granulosicoccus sp.]
MTNKALPAGLLLALALESVAAFADELDNPPVPKASATLGKASSDNRVRVALVDAGVNYLLPEISSALARDQNGKLIGYDFWDMDDRPFDSHPGNRGIVQRHGTRTASLIMREAPFAELVPYRYPRPDMSRMADLVAHANKNEVRIIGMPLGGNERVQWEAFERAALDYPDILFVASAGNNGRDIDQQPVYPAALTLPNMLVVSSSDDFGRLAQGVNWGRVSVDYMVPAEHLQVLRFDGSEGRVSGSSYAVPRVVALAARYLHAEPQLRTDDLIKKIRSAFANGAAPRQLAEGYLYDPQFTALHTPVVSRRHTYDSNRIASTATSPGKYPGDKLLVLPLQVLVLDAQWQVPQVMQVLADAERILEQCHIVFDEATVGIVDAPDYMRDLETGSARTLLEAVRLSGSARRVTVVLARDTRMSTPFDAEAFGRGNTRHRPWMSDSVWLTLALEDRAIALAHELFHVLVNSGDHSTAEGSLMLARTTGTNTRLTSEECNLARSRALDLGLVKSSH